MNLLSRIQVRETSEEAKNGKNDQLDFKSMKIDGKSDGRR